MLGFIDVDFFGGVSVSAVVHVGIGEHEAGFVDLDEMAQVNNSSFRVQHDLVTDEFVKWIAHVLVDAPFGKGNGPSVDALSLAIYSGRGNRASVNTGRLRC